MASTTEKRDIAFKHTLDVYHVRTDRQWFEEPYGTRHVVAGADVWESKPPYNDAAAAVLAGLVVQQINYTLTLDPFSDNLLWVAKQNPGVWPFSGPLTDWTLLNTQRTKNWVSPVVNGPSYAYTLRQGNGALIPDGNWEILFSEGLVHLDEGFTHLNMGWVTPLKLTAYRYIGRFLDAIGTDRVFYEVAQVGHGYTIGNCCIPVTYDTVTSRWVLAQANDQNTLAKAIITSVRDADHFELTLFGKVTQSGHGLTPGEYYFLDNAIAGNLVTVSPSVSQPLLYCIDVNTYIVRFERPLDVANSGGTSAESSETFLADCDAACETGDWVYSSAPKVLGRYQVNTVDPANYSKVPAIGIILNKPTATEADVQWRGLLSSSAIGPIARKKICYVGLDGKTTDAPLVAPNYSQAVGTILDTGEMLIRPIWPDVPIIPYVSHYNTLDGSNDCTIANLPTSNRHVSNPNGFFNIYDWIDGSLQPCLNTSPLVLNSTNKCSVLSGSTFQVTVLGANPSGPFLAQYSISLIGNTVSSGSNITITVSGWELDYDKYRAYLNVSIDILALLPNGGRFGVVIMHTNVPEGTFTKSQMNLFYDRQTLISSLSGVSVTETIGSVVKKFLSGVAYYTLGSDFSASILAINDLNDESYPTIQVDVEGPDYGLSALALQGSALTGWNTDWDNAGSSYSNTVWEITVPDITIRSSTANIAARTKDWVDGSWAPSVDAALLIETHSDANTRTVERFYGETWRCPLTADFDAAAARSWDSEIVLGVSDALFFNGGVEHNVDNWQIYAPDALSQPDYSVHTGTQYLVREFQHDGAASSGFTLNVTGTYTSIQYKLAKAWDSTTSGGTVWINGLADYDMASWNNGNPVGGTGGRLSGTHFSFGTNNICNTFSTLYVKIGLVTGQRITGTLSVIFD